MVDFRLVFFPEQDLGAMRADGAARLRSFAAPSAKMASTVTLKSKLDEPGDGSAGNTVARTTLL